MRATTSVARACQSRLHPRLSECPTQRRAPLQGSALLWAQETAAGTRDRSQAQRLHQASSGHCPVPLQSVLLLQSCSCALFRMRGRPCLYVLCSIWSSICHVSVCTLLPHTVTPFYPYTKMRSRISFSQQWCKIMTSSEPLRGSSSFPVKLLLPLLLHLSGGFATNGVCCD
jgi:hypothetical protein